MGNDDIDIVPTPYESKDVEDVYVSGVGEAEDKNVDIHTGLSESCTRLLETILNGQGMEPSV